MPKWRAIHLTEKQEIPTELFLEACEALNQIFTILGKHFVFVRDDIQGNITVRGALHCSRD